MDKKSVVAALFLRLGLLIVDFEVQRTKKIKRSSEEFSEESSIRIKLRLLFPKFWEIFLKN